MHEYSIVQALIEQCEDFAKDNCAQKVTRVEIKIGTMSGVEPTFLKTAYETFKEKTICAEAELAIEISGGNEMYLMRLEME